MLQTTVFAVMVFTCLACGGSEKANDNNADGRPPFEAPLSQGNAIELARSSAADIIGDGPFAKVIAERMTYADAAGASGLRPGSFELPEDMMVWRVSFIDLFYEPQGPGGLLPDEPSCSEVIVIVDDELAQTALLTMRPATGC